MKAITYHGRRDIRMEEFPLPEPGADEVRIAVKDTLLSQFIIDIYLEGHLVDVSKPHPVTQIGLGFVLGQQYGGLIDKVGENVDAQRVGEYVAVAPGIGCKKCDHCRAGYLNYCELFSYHGMIGCHGGMAEACVLPSANAITVPNGQWGLMFECLLVVKSLLRKSEPWIGKGDPVLILGAGPIGLSAAILLRQLYDVDYCIYDILPERLKRASDCGFHTVSASGLEKQYHLVLDCAGTNPETGGSAFMDGLKCVGKSGALMFVGTYLHTTTITPLELLVNEITIGGSYAYTDQDLSQLVANMGSINLEIGSLIENLSLDQIIAEGLLRGEVDRDSFTILAVSQ